MNIQLTVVSLDGTRQLPFTIRHLVNAGYTGRNQQEVQRHIQELAAKGIPGPKSTPVLFPKAPRAIVTDDQIHVYGEETSGEVEYVLLIEDQNTVFVGLGSDHTDRHLEKVDIPRSKQMCPNVLSRTVWPLAEVINQWDELLMRSRVITAQHQLLYQEAPLADILNPKDIMAFVESRIDGPLDGMVVFSGTTGLLTGEFVYAEEFEAELSDERLDRKLTLAYTVVSLNLPTEKPRDHSTSAVTRHRNGCT